MVPVDGQRFSPGQVTVHQPGWDVAKLEDDASRTEALEREFEDRLAESDATGGFLVVVKDGAVLLADGFGDADREGEPVTDETLFLLASVSKVFLATAALSLAEHGLWDLDAPIESHVRGADPAITGRLALSHQAGVPDSSACEAGLDTPSDWARAHAADPVWAPPGVLFNYSNGGFALVGAALEEITGRRLPEVVTDAVFSPAGAESATYDRSDGNVPRAVGQNPSYPVPEAIGCGLIEAAGGAWASARDVSALLRALLGESTAFSAELRAEQLSSQASVSSGGRSDYGHGLFLERYGEELVAYHLGGLPWFGAGLLFIPSRRFGVAFAVNAGNFLPFLHDAVALYFGPELERAELEPELGRLEEYGGAWEDRTGGLGRLRIDVHSDDIVLVPLGGQTSWPLPVEGTFWPDADGEIRYFATRLGVAVKSR
jgi:CubicO group peptidase (beta-lactamase class C family)